MVRFYFISIWILIGSAVFCQDVTRTRTAKEITVKKDTINRKVVTRPVYKHSLDTAFILRQDSTITRLDSILKKKTR